MTDGTADLAFQRTGEGFLALDRDGSVLEANPAARSLLGIDGSLDGTDVSGLPDAIGDLLSDGADDEPVDDAVEISVDGAVSHVEVGVTPVDGDGDVVRLVRLRDATDRLQRHRYRGILEATGDAVYALDPEGRYTYTNRANTELLGYDESEMIGMPVAEIVEAADIERIEEEIAGLLEEGGSGRVVVEHDVITSDGDRVPVENHVSLLTDDGGEFRGTAGVVRDVAERKERERELERYETLLNLMPDTVVVTDTEGHHQEIHGFEGWSGYTEEELIGEPISMTTPEEGVERANEAARELFTNDDVEKVTYEQAVTTKDGEHVPMENHLTLLPPDEDGVIPGSMSVLRNIAERKEREEQLRRQNERLEEFASVVSHDLRNPLNVAHARVRMAQGSDDPELLEKADAALVRMNELIEDLLALAREGRAVGETAPVSLGAVARDAWESVEAPDASLSVDVDATIEADRARLAELFGNLFRNSVEHGSTGSRASPDDAVEHAGPAVRVRVGVIEGPEPSTEGSAFGDESPSDGFYVEDDGPGIPPEEREEVLERGITGSEDGTGYGLAIVEDIAEAHGWSVRVTEGTDGGARFEFSPPDSSGDDESPAG